MNIVIDISSNILQSNILQSNILQSNTIMNEDGDNVFYLIEYIINNYDKYEKKKSYDLILSYMYHCLNFIIYDSLEKNEEEEDDLKYNYYFKKLWDYAIKNNIINSKDVKYMVEIIIINLENPDTLIFLYDLYVKSPIYYSDEWWSSVKYHIRFSDMQYFINRLIETRILTKEVNEKYNLYIDWDQ